MAGEIIRDIVNTQDQMGPRDVTNIVFKLFDETLPTPRGSSKITFVNIGNSFILSHPTNGKMGLGMIGVGGGQVVLGDSRSYVVHRVFSDDDTFYEGLRDNTFIDTTLTTASVSTTSYSASFTTGQVLVSKSVELNNGNVTRATLYVDSAAITNSNNLTFYLSNNGGSNWQACTLGEELTFSTVGQDVRYKVVASGNATISIDVSGTSYPLRVAVVK